MVIYQRSSQRDINGSVWQLLGNFLNIGGNFTLILLLFVDYDDYSISSKGFLPTIVDNNGHLS